MKITDIKVFPLAEDKLKAYVSIVLDDCFVVRDLKVISGNGGLFVAMPSKRRKDGVFKDIAHPLNQSTREEMEKQILDAYLAEIRRAPAGLPRMTAEEAEREDLESHLKDLQAVCDPIIAKVYKQHGGP
jgi:stage V sporulation protein G